MAYQSVEQQEGNGPIDFGRQGLWKIEVQTLVASTAQRSNWTSDLKPVTLITLVSMCILPLTVIFIASEAMTAEKTASEITSDLGIELSDLNYPGIHMNIAFNSHFGGL